MVSYEMVFKKGLKLRNLNKKWIKRNKEQCYKIELSHKQYIMPAYKRKE